MARKKKKTVEDIAAEERKKVVEKLAKDIQEKKFDWIQPWANVGMPRNPFSKQPRYRGGNVFHLMSTGFEDPRWATLKQLHEHHLQVKDEEIRKGAFVELWKVRSFSKTVEGDDGEEESVLVRYPKLVSFYHVYNFDQLVEKPELEGFDRLEPDEVIALAKDIQEKWTEAEGVEFTERNGGACYSPATDRINIPNFELFETSDGYLRTQLHEMTHSTGTRLGRFSAIGSSPFGSESYAFEELVAELGSMFTADSLNCTIGKAEKVAYEQHAGYLQSWLQGLRNDPDMLFKAAAKAQAASDMILKVCKAA